MKIFLAGDWRAKLELRFRQLAESQSTASIFVPLRNLAWTAAKVRNFLNPHKPYRAPIPVISVGNITVGGTGKTPFVKWLVRRLVETGCRPAILTPLGESDDEVKEHAHEDPSRSEFSRVFPGRDRVANVKRAIEWGATVVVLDDGFQFRSLHRDVDIVLWDATSPLFAGNPFLREPLTGLWRATCVVMSKADALSDKERESLRQELEKWAGQGKVVAAFGYEPVGVKLISGDNLLDGKDFRASRFLLLAGVANPRYFFLTARQAGFNAVAMVCFPDHHRYRPSDARLIAELAETENADAILTTRKDAVKLRGLWRGEIPLLILEVKLRWLWGEEKLWETVERVLSCKAHN